MLELNDSGMFCTYSMKSKIVQKNQDHSPSLNKVCINKQRHAARQQCVFSILKKHFFKSTLLNTIQNDRER